MKICLITDPYPPEIRAISYMMRELAEGLVSRGHKVSVVTSWPQRNLQGGVKDREFDEYSKEGEVEVVRVKTPSNHKIGYIFRGLVQLILPYLFMRKIKKYIKGEIDVVIVYSPPLPLGLLGAKIKKRTGAKFLFNIQDIFPQNAIDLDVLKNPILIKFFERMEKKIYQCADKITTHTDTSTKFVKENKLIHPEKILTVSNWIDMEPYRNAKATGKFRAKYCVEDKFVLLFAGIMGPSQNLDFVLDIAKEVADIPEIIFLLAGEGSKKLKLEQKVKELGLQNVVIQPCVSVEEYPYLAKEADVGLACLNRKNMTPVMPGKILSFMASSLPVVAFLHKESDGHSIIREAACGFTLVSDDVGKGADLIRRIYSEKDKIAQYGENGYHYALKHFSKEACIKKLNNILCELVES